MSTRIVDLTASTCALLNKLREDAVERITDDQLIAFAILTTLLVRANPQRSLESLENAARESRTGAPAR